jgi:hypothetical protein
VEPKLLGEIRFFEKIGFLEAVKKFLAVNFPVMTFLQRYAHYVFSDLTGFQNLSGLPHHRFFYSKKNFGVPIIPKFLAI